jgi:hypothetical protein
MMTSFFHWIGAKMHEKKMMKILTGPTTLFNFLPLSSNRLEIEQCVQWKYSMWTKYFLGNKNKHSKCIYRIDTYELYIHVCCSCSRWYIKIIVVLLFSSNLKVNDTCITNLLSLYYEIRYISISIQRITVTSYYEQFILVSKNLF